MMCDLYGANPSDKTLNQLRVDMFLRKSENLKCPLPKMRAMFQEGLTCTSNSHILKVVFVPAKCVLLDYLVSVDNLVFNVQLTARIVASHVYIGKSQMILMSSVYVKVT